MTSPVILMYHQVDTPRSEREHRFCTPPNEFRRQIAWLVNSGYSPVTLNEIIDHLQGNTVLSDRSVHITFDDGFIGVFEHALPVLIENSMPATLFALPGLIGRTNDWMWQRGFPRRALLSCEQLRILAQEGMTIGSHTRSHVKLTEISSNMAESEVTTSKMELEDMLGQEIVHFAYPYGLYSTAVRDIVEHAGYTSACSTRSGFNRLGEDRYLLRRIDIFGTDHLWQFRQKLHFGINKATLLNPFIYYAGRVASRLGFN